MVREGDERPIARDERNRCCQRGRRFSRAAPGRFGARPRRASSGFAEQPAESIAAARNAIPSEPWRLGAAASITSITGSALIALALNAGAFDAERLWAAAHVDEDWQMTQWGRDEMAIARRAARFAEYEAAAQVLKLT